MPKRLNEYFNSDEEALKLLMDEERWNDGKQQALDYLLGLSYDEGYNDGVATAREESERESDDWGGAGCECGCGGVY